MSMEKNSYTKMVDIIENITRIDFSIYSNKDVIRDSVIDDPNGITIPEINNNNEPVKGGVSDRRLGVTDRHECETCGELPLKCPGHFGHIRFVEPVFHMGFLQIVKNILSCICIMCNKLLVYKNETEMAKLLKNKHGKQRFAEIRSICKNVTHCQKENYGCGTPVHKIAIEKKYGNVYLLAEAVKKGTDLDETGEVKKRTPRILTPQLCYDILKSVSNEDYIVMGFSPEKSRPEDMIIINFPVPPVQVRPSIKIEILSSATSDDDLTHKLIDIIKNNESLKNTKGDGSLVKSSSMSDDSMLLQFHVATFFANDILGLPRSQQKNKRATKSMSERLKSKEGRVRGNLMGKRVDQSGRSVITPDPNISIDQVGIPLQIAKTLTYQEVVTKDNIGYLRRLVKNGPKIYPGANYVIKNIVNEYGEDEKVYFAIKHATSKPISINIGNIVERHLINDDFILFNRQPSLHKLSMMGHRCHIINDPTQQTLRVNVCVTVPYNADFDGDEMNVHVPQSIPTVIELRLIANASRHFVSPTTSKIVISPKQDIVMGTYVQTLDQTQIDWKDAMNILMNTSVNLEGNVIKGKNIPGKLLYSEIIPKNINSVRRKETGEISLKIHNSTIVSGVLGNSEITDIIQKSWNQYGGREARNFLDDAQIMTLQYLIRYGFTIGIRDIIMPKQVHRSINIIIETRRKEALAAITEYENDPYIMTSEAFEANLQSTLQASQSDIQKLIMNNFASDSGLFIAILSGSSGTAMNAGQIVGCIGQVIVEGRRIQKRFNNRTLPTFYQHDDSAFARGFCYSSFMSGLNPMEFFFQAMAGREGVISTAIKTSDTGYIQRKLIKFLEDVKVEYDGTVRNANDKIIQCVYGDNGINTERQIEQHIGLLSTNNQGIRDKYVYTKEEINELHKSKTADSKYTLEINDMLYQKLIGMRDKMRRIQKIINIRTVALKESYMMPVNIHQFIVNIVNREDRESNTIVDPYYILSKIKSMYTGRYCRILKCKPTQVGKSIKSKDEHRIKLLLKIYLYDVLTPKKCTHIHKLSKSEFDEIVEYFNKTIVLARVEGGEMVGFVSAQGIGEPMTQTGLKLFHRAGTGANITGGVERINELLRVAKSIKTPIMEIIIDNKYKKDKVIVDKIASYLKYTTLRDVINRVDICYDPNPFNKDSIMNKDGVTNIFEESHGKSGCQTEIHGLPWILRLVLSKEKLIERNVTMLEIKTSFCRNWSSRYEDSKGAKKDYKRIIDKISQCAIVTNFENSPVPIVHIRFDANNYNFNTLVQFQDIVINKYKIKGIPGITESKYVVEKSYVDFDVDGNVLNEKQYVIISEGINLNEIAQINGINLAETQCNDIATIYEMYGVEAARLAFIREFTRAIEGSGVFSNYQHIELLADAVTHTGSLIAVNRHGSSKLDTDPFSRASFERTVEQLLAAAAFGESDHIRSVSAKIMVGSLINGGTGCFDLLLDHIKIKKTLAPKEEIVDVSSLKKRTAVGDLIKRKKIRK